MECTHRKANFCINFILHYEKLITYNKLLSSTNFYQNLSITLANCTEI